MTQSVQAQLAYFGKIPSRGDFLISPYQPDLLQKLDRWVAQARELLARDPHGETVYDHAKPMHFAFLGSQSRLAIAGHLISSRDNASQRFPLLAAAALEVERPLSFLARSPLAFSRLWSRAAAHMRALYECQEPAAALPTLAELRAPIDIDLTNAHEGTFSDFLENETLAGLEHMLLASGHRVRLRGAMLALGSLLEPVMLTHASNLERGLTLPLPTDTFNRSLVAAFWLELIAPFLAQADLEMAILIGAIAERERLVIGFNGASAQTLHSVMDPQAYATHNIDVDDPDWIDDDTRTESVIGKLAVYLEQPQLSLRAAVDAFREAFAAQEE